MEATATLCGLDRKSGVKDLQKYLARRRIDFSHCFEKEDLWKLVVESDTKEQEQQQQKAKENDADGASPPWQPDDGEEATVVLLALRKLLKQNRNKVNFTDYETSAEHKNLLESFPESFRIPRYVCSFYIDEHVHTYFVCCIRYFCKMLLCLPLYYL